jgi:plastocyanin
LATGLLVLTCAGCWPAPLQRIDQVDSAANPRPDSLPAFVPLSPCVDEASYLVGAAVQFGGAVGQQYQPSCLLAHLGDVVTFSGSFSSHPLTPSSRATAASPISPTASGGSATFQFDQLGYFPYYCAQHGSDSGAGMAGVVRVVP